MKALKFLKRMKQTDTPYNFRECELDEAISEIEEAMKPKSCDTCKHRVFHTYDRDFSTFSSKKVKIDKCNIREQLHFNGSCNGICCNRYEPKDNA